MHTLLDFLGRLHPLAVHLPIGFLLAAVLFEGLSRYGDKGAELRPAGSVLLLAGALSAWLTAGTGWLLAGSGDYDADLLWRHRITGIAVAAASSALWFLRNRAAYAPGLIIVSILLATAGHYGGSLTHGADYLWPDKSNQESAEPTTIGPESPVYPTIVQPLLAKKCTSCHNPQKKKGELDLSSPEGIGKGGKNGSVIVPGNAAQSELYKRILLPAHDENRMPPKGKTPLTDTEIKILAWWIDGGAGFDNALAAYPLTPEIERAIRPEAFQNPVFLEKIEPAPEYLLQELKASGIFVRPLGSGSTLLEASLTGSKKWTAEHFQTLKKTAPWICRLDASFSNIDDRFLSEIGPMPRLLRLNLNGTAVTEKGLEHLPASTFLEHLNLTASGVGDKILERLQGHRYLQSLYCAQTPMTPEALARFTAERPKLRVNPATAETPHDTLQMRPPRLQYTRTVFDDTLQVSVLFPHKGVDLFYTLDEASPTTRSIPWKGSPILLTESAKVRAIAAKSGWKNSDPVEADFARRKYKPLKANLLQPPSPKYPGSGGAGLIDGIMGETYTDRAYIGYEGEHLQTDIDFGEILDFHKVFVHCIENNNSWIFLPKRIRTAVSSDGKNWRPGVWKTYPLNSAMQPEKTHLLGVPLPPDARARYLRVQVESPLKNPKWHPGAGQKCWIFVDEILVE